MGGNPISHDYLLETCLTVNKELFDQDANRLLQTIVDYLQHCDLKVSPEIIERIPSTDSVRDII